MEHSRRSGAVRAVCDHTTKELLEIAIRGGGGVTDQDLDCIAEAIDDGRLARTVAKPDHIQGLADVPPGVGRLLAVAFELARRAVLSRPPVVIRGATDVSLIAQRELGSRTRECLLVIACDAANRVLRTEIVSRGSVDRAPVPVREILNAVLRCDGRAFAIAHNHPDGMVQEGPTDADVAATERMASAACVVGLRFLGHVVVSSRAWGSVTYANRPNSVFDAEGSRDSRYFRPSDTRS